MNQTALVLSNNKLLINIDYFGQIKDLYFPTVGQYNHLNQYVNQTFLAIDNKIIKLNEQTCRVKLDYIEHTNIVSIKIELIDYPISLVFTDLVLHDRNIYLRNYTIENHDQSQHSVKLFFQNNFALNESVFADTVVWYQPAGCLVQYKKSSFLAFGSTKKLYQFTCAAKTDNNGLGAYPDENTNLDSNLVSTGNVNSCISFNYDLNAKQKVEGDYFIIAAKSYNEISSSVRFIRSTTFQELFNANAKYWWYKLTSVIKNKQNYIEALTKISDSKKAARAYEIYWKSMILILSGIDSSGAVIAANDGQYLKNGGKDAYSYFWPRDAAFTAQALIEADFKEEAEKVLEFALKVFKRDGFFQHKYIIDPETYTVSPGSSWHPWLGKDGIYQLPIQQDATSLVLLAIEKYYEHFQDKKFIQKHWLGIESMLKFLKSFSLARLSRKSSIESFVESFDIKADYKFNLNLNLIQPSYDIWEQYYGIFTYTALTVFQAIYNGIKLTDIVGAKYLRESLIVAAKDLKNAILEELYDQDNDSFIKGYRINDMQDGVVLDKTMDASLLIAEDIVTDPALRMLLTSSNFRQLEKLKLNTTVGGYARKENDHYLKVNPNIAGNPWPIISCYVLQRELRLGNLPQAILNLEFIINHADETGLIAEQFDPNTGYNLGMKPLMWSHAEYIRAYLKLV